MTRTGVWSVVIVALLGAGGGWLLQLLVSAQSRPAPAPELLGPVLGFAGLAVVALAWRIRRAVRATVSVRVDPEYAVRVVALAKACTYAGALFAGAFAAFILFIATRPIVPAPQLLASIGALVGAAMLLAGGLVAEHFCTLPPDDKDGEPTAAAAGPEPPR